MDIAKIGKAGMIATAFDLLSQATSSCFLPSSAVINSYSFRINPIRSHLLDEL